METFEAIESSRAVKQYDPNHRFTPEEEKKLLGAALLSPTAFNIQQWRFVVLRDMEIRKQIDPGGGVGSGAGNRGLDAGCPGYGL